MSFFDIPAGKGDLPFIFTYVMTKYLNGDMDPGVNIDFLGGA